MSNSMKFAKWKVAVFFISFVYVGVSAYLGYYKDPAQVIRSDAIEYYSYLPAFFIYKDLSLKFKEKDPDFFSKKFIGTLLQNGNSVIKMSMGMSIMYAPFFLIAHVYALFSQYLANGYSVPYGFSITFAALFYYIAGIIVLGRILLSYYKDLAVALVLLLLSFATNISYYLIREPAMSHIYSFFLFSVFIYLTKLWHEKQSIIHTIFVGLVVGLIALVRPTNCIIFIIFLMWNIANWNDAKMKIPFFLKSYKKLICIAVCAIAVWIPQMIYWYHLTGHFLFYSYTDEGFFFSNPKVLQVLVGFRKGWYVYTPVMLIATFGFIPLFQINRKIFWGTIFFFLINIYIISSWWCWWYGGSYGLRAFIESYTIMAFPLCAFMNLWLKRGPLFIGSILMASFMFVTHNFIQIVKIRNDALSPDSMTMQAYFETFDKMHPTDRYLSLLRSPDYQNARKGLR